MNSINTNSFIDEIERLLLENGLKTESLLIVDDVDRWCITQGILEEKEYHPFRTAKCLYSSIEDKHIILVAETITDDMISSANGVVLIRHGSDYADKLNDHKLFIKHTILHEIGHTKGLSEIECDAFAYDHIAKCSET